MNGRVVSSGLVDSCSSSRPRTTPAARWARRWRRVAWSFSRVGASPRRSPSSGDRSAVARGALLAARGWTSLVTVEAQADICATAARLIADSGDRLGAGRSEFGPRALGNRSILADPRPPEHKDLINAMVKKRECYRPFAPSVLADAAENSSSCRRRRPSSRS